MDTHAATQGGADDIAAALGRPADGSVLDADAIHAELHDALLHHAARKVSSRLDDKKHDDDDVDDGFVAFYPEGSRGVMEGQFPACHAPTSCGAKCAKAVDDALTSCVKWVDADQPSGTPRDACGSTLDHAEKTCGDESPGQVHSCYETAAAGFRGLLTGSER